jgi:iron complex transport system substrate-binding protein
VWVFLKRLIFFIIVLGASNAFARNLVDQTGTSISVPEHPQRIVTLAPSVAELAAEILSVDLQKIVGVAENTDDPPTLQELPSVGPYSHVSIERVLALKPDLVIATTDGNSRDQIEHLRELHIPVFVFSTQNFENIEVALEQMGELLGEKERGLQLGHKFRDALIATRNRSHVRHPSPKSVMLQLDDQPLIVVGGGSFLSEALEIVGAKNAFSDLKSSYPRPSLEEVRKRNPEMIVVLSFGQDKDRFKKMALMWNRFSSLTATRLNQVVLLSSDALLRPSLRSLDGLAALERTIHGSHTP